MSVITRTCGSWISNQGAFRPGRPWGRVVHTLECDARGGIAWALSEKDGYLDNNGLAPHRMTDPTEIVAVLPTRTVGGHVGPRGNPQLVGYEVSGRAAWSTEEWMDDGPRQRALENDAAVIAEDCFHDGWSYDEIRWLSGAQIKSNYNGNTPIRGLLAHNDVSEFIGGTNHWDPGPGFPFAWFIALVQQKFRALTGLKPIDPKPSIPDPQVPDLPTALEGNMFWMHAVGRPIVIVVGGKALDLVGLNYDTVKARLVAAGVPEHNLGNEVQLYDRILSVTAR